MSSAHGESSRLAKDFTSSEGEAEVEADSEAPAINPAHSPDAPRDGSRERNPLSAGSSAEALTGTSKLSAGASPSLKLPTAVIGGKPPRKKSEMDWLHAGPSNKGGSAKADGEAGSSSAAQPSDAAPSKPQKKRPPQKRTAPAATGTGTPDAPASLSVHREVPSSTTAVMYEDPYAEEDELDALNGPASPQPQPPAQPPLAVQRIKLIPPPMPGLMRKMAEGSVAGSEGADAPPKKKRRPPQSRKPAVPGPGKAWRKGLKDADRLKAKSEVPSAPSSVDGIESTAGPAGATTTHPRKRKAPNEALPLPLPATVGAGPSRPAAARKSVGGGDRSVLRDADMSEAEDELAEAARRQAARDRSQGLSDVDFVDDGRDDVGALQMSNAQGPPSHWEPAHPEVRYTKEELRQPANAEALGIPIYKSHIPAKAIPVYRMPSPVRIKERELAQTIPVKTQAGPPPRAWQIGTRIVLGVGGAHIRLKSWMSTGRSPFAAYRQEQAEATRIQQAQAMYEQQNQQMMAGQQVMFDHGYAPVQQPSLQGWTGPDPGAATMPFQGPPVGPDSYHASPGFVNQLSPLPPNQASPAQPPLLAPVPERRLIYAGATTQEPPKKKPQRRRKPGEPDGRTKGARQAKLMGLASGDLGSLQSRPSSPVPADGSAPPVAPSDNGEHPAPSRPSLAPPASGAPDDTADVGAIPPAKPKPKRKSRSKKKAPFAPELFVDPFGDEDEGEGSVAMVKQDSGNSLDKEMEDLL